MNKQIIYTNKAPKPIGPYSQAITYEDKLIFTSGQIALNPETNQVIEGGIKEQTTQVLNNLKAVLEASGSGLSKVIKATVFLKSMDEFVQMNEVYSEFFGESVPARSAVEVSRLPKDVLVEIEVIAFK